MLQTTCPSEVKDITWLFQDTTTSTLQRNLAALAEEAEQKDPVAMGLHTYCVTYRFVAAIHLQADVTETYLDHLERRFPGLNNLAAFNELSPRALEREEDDCIENLKVLAPTVDEGAPLKVHVAQSIFKETVGGDQGSGL
eukprot:superscaffoldBa00005875_g20885